MATYEKLPTQARADVDECVIAYDAGGKRLASATFRAISEARKLKVCETVILGDCIRNRLASLGVLPLAG